MTTTSIETNPSNMFITSTNDLNSKKLCVLLVEAGNQVADALIDRLSEEMDSFKCKPNRKNSEKLVLTLCSSSGLFDDDDLEAADCTEDTAEQDDEEIPQLSRMNEFCISACGKLLSINQNQEKYEKIWMIAINDEEVFENWDEMVQKIKKFGGTQNLMMTPVYWNKKNMIVLDPSFNSSNQNSTELGFPEFMHWIDENI